MNVKVLLFCSHIYLAGFLITLSPNGPFALNSFFRPKTISKVAIMKTNSATGPLLFFFLLLSFSSPFLFLLSFSFVTIRLVFKNSARYRLVGKLKDTFLMCTQGEYLEHSSLINLANHSLLPAWIIFIAASAPVSERSVKLRKLSDSQVPQGWGLLCQLLQRSRCRKCWGERSSRF